MASLSRGVPSIFHYVPGEDNVVADFLSRLPLSEGKSVPGPYGPSHTGAGLENGMTDPLTDSFFSFLVDDPVQLECFLNVLDDPEPVINPVNYEHLQQAQQNDAAIWNLPQMVPAQYSYQPFGNSQYVIDQLYNTIGKSWYLTVYLLIWCSGIILSFVMREWTIYIGLYQLSISIDTCKLMLKIGVEHALHVNDIKHWVEVMAN